MGARLSATEPLLKMTVWRLVVVACCAQAQSWSSSPASLPELPSGPSFSSRACEFETVRGPGGCVCPENACVWLVLAWLCVPSAARHVGTSFRSSAEAHIVEEVHCEVAQHVQISKSGHGRSPAPAEAMVRGARFGILCGCHRQLTARQLSQRPERVRCMVQAQLRVAPFTMAVPQLPWRSW